MANIFSEILENKQTIQLLKGKIRNYRKQFIILVISIAIITIINIQIPFFLGSITKVFLEKSDDYSIIYIVLGLFVFKSVVQYFLTYFTKYVSETVTLEMKRHFMEKYIHVYISKIEAIKRGEIIQRIFQEVGFVQGKLLFGSIYFIKDVIFLLLLLVLILYLSPKVLLALLVLMLIFGSYNSVQGKKFEKNDLAIQKTNASLLSYFIEVMSGKKDIFIYKLFQPAKGQISTYTDKLKEEIRTGSNLNGLNAFVTEILLLLFSVVVVLILYIDNFTAAEIITLVSGITLLNLPIQNLHHFIIDMRRVLPSMRRVESLLEIIHPDKELEFNHHYLLQNAKELSIDIENLYFQYLNSPAIFQGFNKSFTKGFHLLKGANGRGKSTLLELLVGLRAPQSGSIKIESPYTDIPYTDLFCLVQQDSFLFNDTIYNNLKLVSPSLDKEHCTSLMKACNIYEIFQKLEEGIDAKVGEDSNSLSGGERQLISILRGLIKDAPILLLDEITNNLPESVIDGLLKYICAKRKDKLTILVSHQNLDGKYFNTITNI